MTPGYDTAELARRAAAAVLSSRDPDLATQLEGSFEGEWARIERNLPEEPWTAGDSGHPIDPGFFVGSLVASTLWAAAFFAQAAVASRPKERAKRISRLVAPLLALARDPEDTLALAEMTRRLAEIADRLAAAPVPPDPTSDEEAPADLRLQVTRSGKHYSYLLTSRDPTVDLPRDVLFSPPLTEPESFARGLLRDLDALGDQTEEERAISRLRILAIARDLAVRLLPEELSVALGKLWGRTLELRTEDTEIPWELVAVRRPDGGIETLAEAFDLARTFARRPAAAALRLKRLAWVAPSDYRLDQRAEERAALSSHLGSAGVVTVGSTFLAVLSALADQDFDGWHFATHGTARATEADRRGLILDTGEFLVGRDVGLATGRIAAGRPLVFLNACGSARSGPSLSGTAGLVPAFVEAGAGAVIGTQWPVRDSAASAFAAAFYDGLFKDRLPVAAALRAARRKVQSLWPGHPAALAYVLYARPDTRLA
ncbi:MAG TPA: CHAT domain-containing protein [Thermoanaerobaculia bacterium]|nr:CHAT domain-containing protein [Thermoanaerobaculia bacterium]